MKINQIIREKRKELSLTQEQIADFLGVSTPAVNKWEKGSTYPDITLLPALARLFKIDLNTLMSFNDNLTDIEIENFIDEVDQTVREQGYDAAFQKAISKIHEYPTCENLIYSVILYLEGVLALYNVSENPKYRETYETFLINALPFSTIDKEEQTAILYQQQERYQDAEKIWEHRILKCVTQIQTVLVNMLETALHEKRQNDADFFADMYEAVTRQFCFPEWMRYNAHLQLALVKKDKDRSLSVLQKMLPAMRKEWNAQDYQLYRNVNGSSSTFFSGKLAKTITDELTNNEEYSFLRDGSEFEELMAQLES